MVSRYKIFLIGLWLSISSSMFAQRVIYVPWGMDEFYTFTVEDPISITYGGKNLELQQVKIKGIYISFAHTLGLDLSGYLQVEVDEKMMSSDYQVSLDESGYFCQECKGRYSLFIPYSEVSQIEFKKREIVEIRLHGHIKPMYAYIYRIELSGIKDVNDSSGDVVTMEKPGDRIVFPEIKLNKIEPNSDITAVVTLDDGTKRVMRDFRPESFCIESNSGTDEVSVKDIRELRVLDPLRVICSAKYRNGSENTIEIPWNNGGFAGIAGMGKNHYEHVAWHNIVSIEFQ